MRYYKQGLFGIWSHVDPTQNHDWQTLKYIVSKHLPFCFLTLQMNHRKDFKNAVKLAQTLHQAWQKMTKLHTESLNTEQPIQEAEDAAQAMDAIKAWSETEEEKRKCAQHLNDLLQVRESLVRTSMNLQAWTDLYLSKPPVQKYLRFVMEATQDPSSEDTEYIKLLMRQLVKPTDVCVVRDLTDIAMWLCYTDKAEAVTALECTDIVTLKMIVETNLDKMILAKGKSSSLYEESPEQQDVKIQATSIVAKAVNYLITGFREAKLKYEELFLVTLLFPCQYDISDRIFLRLLSTCDLEYLKKEFEEQSKGFVIEPPMKVQAYLFHLTVKMYSREDVYVTEAQVKCHLEFLQKEMESGIDPHLSHVLFQFRSGKSDWKTLQFQLASLENGIVLERKQECRELLHILTESETAKPSPHSEISKPLHKVPSGDVQELFKKLDLLKYYPQKLTLHDALLIRKETLSNKPCTKFELLPYFILQKLMMHDFKCRGVVFKNETTSNSLTLAKPSQQHDDFDEFDDFDDNVVSSSSGGDILTVNPMDGLLALLHCSDNFLRQELSSKLATCQLAVPFLLPDPFTHNVSLSLWAMRTIAKEWKCTDPSTGKIRPEGCPIVKCATPIVSFFRLTSNRSEHSKSRLLNAIISTSDSPHNYFFNFHCDGGSTQSVLMDGLVELCWYLPAGKPESDHFTQVVTFTNLRGDALRHPKQTNFLSRVSFMNFVLLTEDNLEEKGIKLLQNLAKAPGGIVLLFLDKNFTQKARMAQLMNSISKDKCFRMKVTGKSEADIKNSVREQIRKRLTGLQQRFKTIEDCAEVARSNGIVVDEDHQGCLQGRALAEDVQKVLTELKTSGKDEVLPLQSRKLWHEWAKHDKERHRHINKGNKGVEQYNESMEDQKLMIRMQQLSLAESLSPLMKHFLSNLLKHKGDIRNYFLQWLKFFLDDHSRNILPKLFHQYQEVRMQLLKLQQEHKTEDAAKGPLKEKLSQLNEKLVHASFGLEHLLREIGQVYEAAVEQKHISSELREQVKHLPQVAAELLDSGYPLELMDGDASHVPLCWVMAVLDKLRELHQDANLFVLSVLGIQSTGKSTLLNTMFGLRFTVSAGRCTRGAFMQLLPFNESLKKETLCDYLLIIDTEGLRAPELSSQETQKHDNELATFVIGLANVTLINIFGETPGDMEDILQRAVHAFIRMEHVGLKPKCQFVHQNVGAISCASRGMMGRVNFQERLNRMTKAAANEEGLGGRYTMFSHVIDFNEEKDVWYFPGLWKGDPPMSPVNPGYSDGAQQLKSGLIEIAGVQCLLSAFQARIKDLWKAILHENFIFSFKNTLEITAYNSLDAKYAQWSWEFQRRMLQWQEEAKHRIESTPIEKLNDFKGKLMNELSVEGAKIHAEIESEMKKFFEESKQRDILAQWQRRTQLRLDEVRKEHKANAEQQCRVLISGRQALAKADTMKQHHQSELLLLVKEQVSHLEKGRLNDNQLDKLFEKKWLEWMTELKSSQHIDQSSPDIDGSLENCLRELLATHQQLLLPKLTVAPLRTRTKTPLTHPVTPYSHITANRQWSVGKLLRGQTNLRAEVTPSHVEIAKRKTKEFLSQAKEYLDGKKKSKQNFNQVFCHELLKNLLEAIADSQKECPEFSFTPEYKVSMALTVCGYAKTAFEGMAKEFKQMNDPIEYLQREMKTPYRRLFKSQYQQTAQEKTAAYNLCDRLVKPIEEALKGKLAQKIAVDVKSSSSHFSTKKSLKAKIISDLADKANFEEYALYLTDVRRSVRTWVKRYTKQHCEQFQSGKTRFTELAETELERLVASISTAAKKVTRSFPKAGIKQWLVGFHSELMTELSLDLGEMQKVVGDLKDFKNFTEELCKKLADLNVNEFKSLYDMDKWDEQPHDILLKTLIGCCEQCPFCKEQCELTNSNHSEMKHTVDLHRSQCLGGWRWSDSDKMILETCNAIVASDGDFYYYKDGERKRHPRKKYGEVYPSWTISPDGSLEAASYWKWFLAKYTTDVAKYFNMEPTEIPASWRSLTREKVKEDLKGLYHL